MGQEAVRNVNLVAVAVHHIEADAVARKRNDLRDGDVVELDKGILPLLACGQNIDAQGVVQIAHRDLRGSWNRTRANHLQGVAVDGLELGAVVVHAHTAGKLDQIAGEQVLYVGQGEELTLCIGVNAHALHAAERTRRALSDRIHQEKEGTVTALNGARCYLRDIPWSDYNAVGHDGVAQVGRRVVTGSQVRGRYVLDVGDGGVGQGLAKCGKTP